MSLRRGTSSAWDDARPPPSTDTRAAAGSPTSLLRCGVLGSGSLSGVDPGRRNVPRNPPSTHLQPFSPEAREPPCRVIQLPCVHEHTLVPFGPAMKLPFKSGLARPPLSDLPPGQICPDGALHCPTVLDQVTVSANVGIHRVAQKKQVTTKHTFVKGIGPPCPGCWSQAHALGFVA